MNPETNPKNFVYDHCDDWMIFARNPAGDLFFVVTEMWPEWLDLHDGADQERGAVERFMLPVALAKWDQLNWIPTR